MAAEVFEGTITDLYLPKRNKPPVGARRKAKKRCCSSACHEASRRKGEAPTRDAPGLRGACREDRRGSSGSLGNRLTGGSPKVPPLRAADSPTCDISTPRKLADFAALPAVAGPCSGAGLLYFRGFAGPLSTMGLRSPCHLPRITRVLNSAAAGRRLAQRTAALQAVVTLATAAGLPAVRPRCRARCAGGRRGDDARRPAWPPGALRGRACQAPGMALGRLLLGMAAKWMVVIVGVCPRDRGVAPAAAGGAGRRGARRGWHVVGDETWCEQLRKRCVSPEKSSGGLTEYIVHHLTHNRCRWTGHDVPLRLVDVRAASSACSAASCCGRRRARRPPACRPSPRRFVEMVVEFVDSQVKDTFHGDSKLHRAAGADDLLSGVPDELHGPAAGGPARRWAVTRRRRRAAHHPTCAWCRPPTSTPRSAMSLAVFLLIHLRAIKAQGRLAASPRNCSPRRSTRTARSARSLLAPANLLLQPRSRTLSKPGFAGHATVRQHVRRRADLHADRA